jgi:NADPH:quinone reductase-like Zn-dependent oxidoreductase
MSRLVLTEVGGDAARTVRWEEGPAPALGPEDVLVAVEAAPINPGDLLLAAGWFSVQPRLPWPMGAEGVGRVERVGSAADPALAGRRVIILPTFEQGTWADRVAVLARNVVPVPDGGDQHDIAQLAMLAVNPATAFALLNDYVSLQPGDWIAQTLGNSAVGQYVTVLAHRAGVRTLSVVRRDDGKLRKLGGDIVLADGPDLAERAAATLGGASPRLVLDGVGGTKPGELTGLLDAGGTVVSYASQAGESPVIPLPDLIYRGISLRSFFIVNWVTSTPRERLEAVYAELAGLVERGVIRADVAATYPLTASAEALAHVQSPVRTGKILFIPGVTG